MDEHQRVLWVDSSHTARRIVAYFATLPGQCFLAVGSVVRLVVYARAALVDQCPSRVDVADIRYAVRPADSLRSVLYAGLVEAGHDLRNVDPEGAIDPVAIEWWRLASRHAAWTDDVSRDLGTVDCESSELVSAGLLASRLLDRLLIARQGGLTLGATVTIQRGDHAGHSARLMGARWLEDDEHERVADGRPVAYDAEVAVDGLPQRVTVFPDEL